MNIMDYIKCKKILNKLRFQLGQGIKIETNNIEEMKYYDGFISEDNNFYKIQNFINKTDYQNTPIEIATYINYINNYKINDKLINFPNILVNRYNFVYTKSDFSNNQKL